MHEHECEECGRPCKSALEAKWCADFDLTESD